MQGCLAEPWWQIGFVVVAALVALTVVLLTSTTVAVTIKKLRKEREYGGMRTLDEVLRDFIVVRAEYPNLNKAELDELAEHRQAKCVLHYADLVTEVAENPLTLKLVYGLFRRRQGVPYTKKRIGLLLIATGVIIGVEMERGGHKMPNLR